LENFFALTLNTKPFLKKYLQSLYGSPIIFSSNNCLGVILIGLLERPYKPHKNTEAIQYRVFDKYDCPIEIFLPKTFLTKYRYGHTLSDQHVITLNKFFENMFEEDLGKEMVLAGVYKVKLKKAMEEFCFRHLISIEEDITYDALKQKAYRYRKANGKNIRKKIQNLPPHLSS
jgi:hypothetical protein